MFLFLAATAYASATYPPPRAELVLGGADNTTLDLWRAYPGADKVYVKVGFPDGSEGLFLFDTGAAISVIHASVAAQLGLPTTALDGRIEGLSGSSPWTRAVIPRITLGDLKLNAVDVAVGVPGVPELAGALPVAGILGNNVWTNFVMEVDYPADTLVLHAPGTKKVKGGAPLYVEDMHAYTPVQLLTTEGIRSTVPLEVDTGAGDLLLYGSTGEAFRPHSTQGVEPVLGIGADLDELPLENFLEVTRRVQVSEVKAGGRKLKHRTAARWYGADSPRDSRLVLPGLLGYAPMRQWNAVFDFPGGKFSLEKSKRVPRQFEAAKAWLAIEQERYGDDPARAIIRARLQYRANDVEAAKATINAGLAANPGDAELVALMSWVQRNGQEWDASLATLDGAEPLALAVEHEWVAWIDSLIVAGQAERALAEAKAAIDTSDPTFPKWDDLHVAYSDALLANGQTAEAAVAIEEAVRAGHGASAHLLRRARAAMAERDRYGAMVALRDLWTIYPLNGVPMWLYATLASPDDVPGFVADMDNALARLHPGDEPWDFVGAALLAVGQTDRGKDALAKGYARDCAPMPEGPDRKNCDAWYWALGGERLDEAEARIRAAITEVPWASAYHDTAATVFSAAGKAADAREAAHRAAQASPGDPYLLWQLDRMTAKAEKK